MHCQPLGRLRNEKASAWNLGVESRRGRPALLSSGQGTWQYFILRPWVVEDLVINLDVYNNIMQ